MPPTCPVAPLAGARIEIYSTNYLINSCHVAPLAGARIEIVSLSISALLPARRSPRGSED